MEGARVFRSKDQAVIHSELTKLVFDNVRFDYGGLFDIEQPTRLTAPIDGVYLINAEIIWECFPQGIRQLAIRLNNKRIISTDRRQDIDGWAAFNTCITTWEMKKGDYVEAEVFWWNPRLSHSCISRPYIFVKRAKHWDSPEFMMQRL